MRNLVISAMVLAVLAVASPAAARDDDGIDWTFGARVGLFTSSPDYSDTGIGYGAEVTAWWPDGLGFGVSLEYLKKSESFGDFTSSETLMPIQFSFQRRSGGQKARFRYYYGAGPSIIVMVDSYSSPWGESSYRDWQLGFNLLGGIQFNNMLLEIRYDTSGLFSDDSLCIWTGVRF